ncbi:MAG: phnA protein [Verrucomicrobiota bacterium]
MNRAFQLNSAAAELSGRMAKGYDANQERLQALSMLGKDLARRAKSKCEVCEAAGVSLKPYEIPPAPKEPDLEKTILVCERCESALTNPKTKFNGEEWRALANTIWTETPAAQVAIVRLLKRIAETSDWAREALDEAYLDTEVEEWVNAAS